MVFDTADEGIQQFDWAEEGYRLCRILFVSLTTFFKPSCCSGVSVGGSTFLCRTVYLFFDPRLATFDFCHCQMINSPASEIATITAAEKAKSTRLFYVSENVIENRPDFTDVPIHSSIPSYPRPNTRRHRYPQRSERHSRGR